MTLALALAYVLAAPKSVEMYTLKLDTSSAVRVRINDIEVSDSGLGVIPIGHYLVPGANRLQLDAAGKGKLTGTIAHVRLVVSTGSYSAWTSGYESWRDENGHDIAALKAGASVVTLPTTLQEPLWLLGSPISIDGRTLVSLQAKIAELQGLLAAGKVDDYLERFAASYDETARLYPMAEAKRLRKRDAQRLKRELEQAPVAAAPAVGALSCELEASGLLVACRRKGHKDTLSIGETPINLRFMHVDGGFRPYAIIPL